MRRLAFVLIALLLANGAIAPAETADHARGIALEGIERGIDQGDEENHDADRWRLNIAELSVDARIAGPLADVEMEMLIASTSQNSESELAARLALDLPEDAVVTGYALDVDGAMIPGQLLEAPRARAIFDDTVRQGIDPGLGEVSTENIFSTNIYPVTPEKPRRFRVRFSVPFDPAKGLSLPLASDQPIGKTWVAVSLQGYAAAPELRFAGKQLGMAREGDRWLARGQFGEVRADQGLSLGSGTLVAPALALRHANGNRFFVISDHAQAPAAGAEAAGGGRLRVFWDGSLSHRGAGKADEIDAVVALAEARHPQGIDLVTFASGKPQVQALADAPALRAALGKVTYRGATSLAGLDQLALPAAQQCLLVGDGHMTLDHAATFDPDCALSTLSADHGADGLRLGRIAQKHRGRFVRIAKGAGAAAAAGLGASGYSVVSVRDDQGRQIPWRTLPAPQGGWLLVGELPQGYRAGSSAPIVLRVVGPDGRAAPIEYRIEQSDIKLDAAGALWASDRAAELSDDPARHDAMVALSRAYQVASPSMGFLVLESPDQYLNAELAPPPGFSKDWMEEYSRGKKNQDQDRAEAKEDRLEHVIDAWQDRKDWWEQQFEPQPKAPKPKKAANPPAAPADAAGDRQIVVTAQRRYEGPTTNVDLTLDATLADRPYLKALNDADDDARPAVLAKLEEQYGQAPTFYLDAAEWYRMRGDNETARALLLSALELPASDSETRRIIGFRLERDGDYEHAVQIAERIMVDNPLLPQTKRSLALTLASRGIAAGPAGKADLERAFALLTQVVLDPPIDGHDFDGLEVVALMEANALIPRIEALGGKWQLDPRLVALIDTDLRIVIEWTADDADIDLWVDEPNGERVMYSHSLSSGGGQISNDMTDGYGPEEYAIHRAYKGEYKVRINGYDADRINPNGPGHVLVRLIRNFGRPDQSETRIDIDLRFQQGRNRDVEGLAKPLATFKVK